MLTWDIELMPDDNGGIRRWPSDMVAPSAKGPVVKVCERGVVGITPGHFKNVLKHL